MINSSASIIVDICNIDIYSMSIKIQDILCGEAVSLKSIDTVIDARAGKLDFNGRDQKILGKLLDETYNFIILKELNKRRWVKEPKVKKG